MKVRELISVLMKLDQEAVVVVDGFETMNTKVAEIDTVNVCHTAPGKSDPICGNRTYVSDDNANSVWLGWSGDYRGTTGIAPVK